MQFLVNVIEKSKDGYNVETVSAKLVVGKHFTKPESVRELTRDELLRVADFLNKHDAFAEILA